MPEKRLLTTNELKRLLEEAGLEETPAEVEALRKQASQLAVLIAALEDHDHAASPPRRDPPG